MNIKVKIVNVFEPNQTIRAIANVVFDDCFVINGVKIISCSKGMFVAMPNNKLKGEYKEICHPITSEFRIELQNAVLNAFEQTRK
ncbi:MAG: SpoVG family protein [Clostridia bacterium]